MNDHREYLQVSNIGPDHVLAIVPPSGKVEKNRMSVKEKKIIAMLILVIG